MDVVTLESGTYWKLRAKMGDHERLVLQAQRQIAESSQALNAEMAAVGLDPQQRYQLRDADYTAHPETGPVALASKPRKR